MMTINHKKTLIAQVIVLALHFGTMERVSVTAFSPTKPGMLTVPFSQSTGGTNWSNNLSYRKGSIQNEHQVGMENNICPLLEVPETSSYDCRYMY